MMLIHICAIFLQFFIAKMQCAWVSTESDNPIKVSYETCSQPKNQQWGSPFISSFFCIVQYWMDLMIPGLFYHIVCWTCVYVCMTPKPYIDVNVNVSIKFLLTYTYLLMKSLEIRLYSHWNLFLADYKSPFMQILHGLAAWQHQAITWSKVDLSSKVFCDIYPDIYVKTTAMEF